MDKTTKLPNNNMQPSTNLLNCDNQTINLPENSKEPINSNMDTTTKLQNEIQPSTKLLNCVHQTINLPEISKENSSIKRVKLSNY